VVNYTLLRLVYPEVTTSLMRTVFMNKLTPIIFKIQRNHLNHFCRSHICDTYSSELLYRNTSKYTANAYLDTINWFYGHVWIAKAPTGRYNAWWNDSFSLEISVQVRHTWRLRIVRHAYRTSNTRNSIEEALPFVNVCARTSLVQHQYIELFSKDLIAVTTAVTCHLFVGALGC